MTAFLLLLHQRKTIWFITAAMLIALFLVAGILRRDAGSEAHASDTARISVLIATGMPGGTYYRVGLGMASLWTTRLKGAGIRVSAAISEGSRENIEAIRIADADVILAESVFCSMAYEGTGIYKGKALPELRSISTLWPDVVHLLIRKQAMKTGTLVDLEGLIVATGLPDSGNRFNTELLLDTLKPGGKSVRLRSMSNMAAAEALRNGTVQAMSLTGGIPVPLVTQLLQANQPRLGILQITDQRIKALRDKGWSHVERSVIPPGTYPGQDGPVRSLGFANALATSSSLSPQVVYALTKTLYENLDYLAKVHPACRKIDLARALSGLEVPLHPGALTYYRERKVAIPEHLLP